MNSKTNPTPMMKFFEYGHLPKKLAEISAPFCELAESLNSRFDLCPREKQVAIRKLLEAKDAAVRAAI